MLRDPFLNSILSASGADFVPFFAPFSRFALPIKPRDAFVSNARRYRVELYRSEFFENGVFGKALSNFVVVAILLVISSRHSEPRR